ncbi:hypothetical protein BJ138DRAFT_1177837 [Hygrophoropsis aurantiaca]|uniref:Uncharacterized protein n=1 Tax=Hygrophoropsis aurantiaca TaxID=72124 RepID=A0ACB8AKN9_9AGAM|nr:hypothetical protein BJ138DRAFT_1177837 [Hygrophoropsis aurantiaca]
MSFLQYQLHSLDRLPRVPIESLHPTQKANFRSRDIRKHTKQTDIYKLRHSHAIETSHGKQGPPKAADYESKEVYNVPNPVPDTGMPPSREVIVYDTPAPIPAPTPSAFATVHSQVTATHAAVVASTFTPLPPLLSPDPTLAQTLKYTQTFSSEIHNTTAFLGVKAVETQSSHGSAGIHFSKTAIIVLSVIGGLVLLGALILIRLLRRPRRRKTPTPSLPILQDGLFPDQKYESEGSPVFGGKERFSPSLRNTRGNTGLWTWTQYHSGIPKPAPVLNVTNSEERDFVEPNGASGQSYRNSISDQDRYRYPFTGHGVSGTKPAQPAQSAITRAVSRLSTVSMSLYPNSPRNSNIGTDVGVALDGAVPMSYEGQANLKRVKEKAAAKNRLSMMASPSTKDSSRIRRSQTYGGIDVNSPAMPSRTEALAPGGGRARIQSTYYTPGAYPRTSVAPHTASAQGQSYNNLQPHHALGLNRSDSQRGPKTHALTTALGLVSPPPPPSPQPTLYPDDSMSVIGESKKVIITGNGRNQKKPVPKNIAGYDKLSSPLSESAALGSLMLVDFAASKSTASLVNIRPSEVAREARDGQTSGASKQMKPSLKKRVEDKPPRVPSPPPIPSLAQMALAHTNPEAYADYHSPTYSIYGLYDADRKSRGTSFGY